MCFKKVLSESSQKKLDNHKFLDEFAKAFYFLTSGKIAALKNLDSEYIASTESYAQLVGYISQDLIYKTDRDLKCTMVNLIENYKQQDDLIKLTGKSLTTIEIHNYAIGRGMYLFYRRPVINPTTQCIVGIHIEVEPFNTPAISNIFSKNSNKNIKRKTLGQKQEEVLFCILVGIRESKKIVDFIYRAKGCTYSVYTVNNAIRSLYKKFKANCKDSLIKNALHFNDPIYPPRSLLEFGSYSIKHDSFINL